MLPLGLPSASLVLLAAMALACSTVPLAAQSGGSTPLGVVDRLQGEATLARQADLIALDKGSEVVCGDTVKTGADSRLTILFNDGTRLTLGESAEAFIADFVYNPIRKSGAALLDVLKGAFRFTSGEIGRLNDKRIRLRTANATAASYSDRDLDVWGGPIDDTYGLLLLRGEIEVRNDSGMVLLDKKRLGSIIPAGQAPDRPAHWGKEKASKAFAAVAFK